MDEWIPAQVHDISIDIPSPFIPSHVKAILQRPRYLEIGFLEITNTSFLNYTVQSGAPDHAIRSVSSRQYGRFRRGPKPIANLIQKLIY